MPTSLPTASEILGNVSEIPRSWSPGVCQISFHGLKNVRRGQIGAITKGVQVNGCEPRGFDLNKAIGQLALWRQHLK